MCLWIAQFRALEKSNHNFAYAWASLLKFWHSLAKNHVPLNSLQMWLWLMHFSQSCGTFPRCAFLILMSLHKFSFARRRARQWKQHQIQSLILDYESISFGNIRGLARFGSRVCIFLILFQKYVFWFLQTIWHVSITINVSYISQDSDFGPRNDGKKICNMKE